MFLEPCCYLAECRRKSASLQVALPRPGALGEHLSCHLGTLVGAGLMKLRQIADALGCRLIGDGEIEIHGVSGMENATAGQLTFLANPKYAPKVKHTKASAIR